MPLILRDQRDGSRPEFFRSGVGVEGNVGVAAEAIGRESAPIQSWVENISAAFGFPFHPSVGASAPAGVPPDHEANVAGAGRLHPLVKVYGFRFAIGRRAGFRFGRRFPFATESVRNGAQVADPKINHAESEFAA